MMRGIAVFLLLATVMGCGTKTDERVLENLGITQSIAYDLEDEEQDGDTPKRLRTTIIFPNTDPISRNEVYVISAVAESSKAGRVILARQTKRTLVSGQMRSAIFGEDLAKEGLRPYMDTLYRDPTIGTRVRVAVVEGKASEILYRKDKEDPRIGRYVDRLLEKEAEKHDIPEITLHRWLRDYLDDGIDPVMPLIVNAKTAVSTSGIGLFLEDRLVHKLSPQESIYFVLLFENFRQGEVGITLKSDNGTDVPIMLSSIINSRKIHVSRLSDPPYFRVSINVHIEGSITEYMGEHDLGDYQQIFKLEQDIARFMQDKLNAMIQHMQKHRVDSIGIGKKVRNMLRYKEWKALDWRETYAQMDINVQVKVSIKDTGNIQ